MHSLFLNIILAFTVFLRPLCTGEPVDVMRWVLLGLSRFSPAEG